METKEIIELLEGLHKELNDHPEHFTPFDLGIIAGGAMLLEQDTLKIMQEGTFSKVHHG